MALHRPSPPPRRGFIAAGLLGLFIVCLSLTLYPAPHRSEGLIAIGGVIATLLLAYFVLGASRRPRDADRAPAHQDRANAPAQPDAGARRSESGA